MVWQEQPASLRSGIFNDHAHEASQQAVQMCLGSNGLRSLEETTDVKSVSPYAGRLGCDSKIGVSGLEVHDFGVCAPAGIGRVSVTQVVVGKAGLPTRQIEQAGELVCQRFVIEVAVLLRQGNGGIIVFTSFRRTVFDASTLAFYQVELVQEVHGCDLCP